MSETGFQKRHHRRKAKPSAIATATAIAQHLKYFFQDMPDPRVERTRAHQLSDILVIAILAVIAGAQGWEDIENYGDSKQPWLEQFLELPNGIACADTFRRIFERLDPIAFEQRFRSFVQTLVSELGTQVIAIDGKTARSSYDRNKRTSAMQLVSAFASEHRLVLGQFKVRHKSNKITAIPELLARLDVRGCIVTLDAMGTQTKIAGQIRAVGADYVLALKANHGHLYKQVCQSFQEAEAQEFAHLEHSYDEREESSHYRVEKRQVWSMAVSALPEIQPLSEWAGVQSVVKVVRVRQLWKTTRQEHYYLSSLPAESRVLGQAIRQHWSIENQLHWVLDVTMGEDGCRVRTGHAPQNLSVLRRLAINALNQEKSCRRSLRQKHNRAAMDDEYMLKVLMACLSTGSNTNEPACR